MLKAMRLEGAVEVMADGRNYDKEVDKGKGLVYTSLKTKIA